MEEFMALEKLREQEEQLKQIMIYAGRPGLWGDWQKFQAKARVARREAEEAAARKRKKIFEITLSHLFLIGDRYHWVILLLLCTTTANYKSLAKIRVL